MPVLQINYLKQERQRDMVNTAGEHVAVGYTVVPYPHFKQDS